MVVNKRELVLIHGWGFGYHVWQRLLPYLEDHWHVTLIELPGYSAQQATSMPQDIDYLAYQMIATIPKDSVVLAWSLGGLLATRMVELCNQIAALVLLASSPCFINTGNWRHGIDEEDFDRLARDLHRDKEWTLRKFAGLVAIGDNHPKEIIAILLQNQIYPNMATLVASLSLLRRIDMRASFINLTCPTGMILGTNDVLIKRAIGPTMRKIGTDIHYIEIDNTGHAPFISRPKKVAESLMLLTAKLLPTT